MLDDTFGYSNLEHVVELTKWLRRYDLRDYGTCIHGQSRLRPCEPCLTIGCKPILFNSELQWRFECIGRDARRRITHRIDLAIADRYHFTPMRED